ncbi:hypothetical protein HIM_03859 [Hirsutella minnesotensis 3608]|uniref:Cytochrome P450 n=1 Tax=Hirsutella minnesotensis 3608 TaxID=1043627 RepID=A0A0F8A2F2_9HYPO|nr:hypothetical protein HIM_03859 [Hirsutella minnesotensis 3608]
MALLGAVGVVSAATSLFDKTVLHLDLGLAVALLALFALLPLLSRTTSHIINFISWSSSKKATSSSLPHVSSLVPWIGHALELRRRGARHIHQLIVNTSAEIFTIDILSKRVFVLNPSLDRALAKNVHQTSLARVISFIGHRSLGFTKEGVRTIAEHDPRPVHSQLFANCRGAASLSAQSAEYIRDQVLGQPREQDTDAGRWVFNLVLGASAHALWGPRNPWNEDPEFLKQFVIVSDGLESLSQPLAQYTAKQTYQARDFLLEKLMAFHRANPKCAEQSVAHYINAIAMNDQDWRNNKDYYRCELLEALGLLATASTLSAWLLRHLLASPELLEKVVREVRMLKPSEPSTACSPASERMEGEDIRITCPHLVAAWYETLRLHVTAVPRVASGDFDLAVSSLDAPVSIKEGDVLLLPMMSFNLDPKTWGPDAATFSAERFIDDAGRLRVQKARKVRGFGVAGNLCPGRNFGFDTAMAALTMLLRGFEMSRPHNSGTGFPEPKPMAGTNVGFERIADDVSVRLTRL